MSKKFCRCGKLIEVNEKCPCKKKQHRSKADIERNKVLVSSKWKKFRMSIIRRDGAHCQRCKIKYGLINIRDLQLHHIKPRINYPELTFEATNCVTLCQLCNTQLGIKEELDFKFEAEELEPITFL